MYNESKLSVPVFSYVLQVSVSSFVVKILSFIYKGTHNLMDKIYDLQKVNIYGK